MKENIHYHQSPNTIKTGRIAIVSIFGCLFFFLLEGQLTMY